MLARLADKQAGAKALRLKNDPGAVRPRAPAETQKMGGARWRCSPSGWAGRFLGQRVHDRAKMNSPPCAITLALY